MKVQKEFPFSEGVDIRPQNRRQRQTRANDSANLVFGIEGRDSISTEKVIENVTKGLRLDTRRGLNLSQIQNRSFRRHDVTVRDNGQGHVAAFRPHSIKDVNLLGKRKENVADGLPYEGTTDGQGMFSIYVA